MTTIRPGALRRLQRLLRDQGVVATIKHYGKVLWKFGQRLAPAEQKRAQEERARDEEFARKRRAIDAEFDARYGVDTGGKDDLVDHALVGPNQHEGNFYMGIFPDIFNGAVESLHIPPAEWTFLDIGAGKGRALLLAQLLGFKRAIGVEYSQNLVTVCRRNLESFARNRPGLPPAEIHCMDALQYEIPAGPLLIFLANPFGGELMRTLCQRIHQAVLARPAPIRIIYYNPVCDNMLVETIGGLRRLSSEDKLTTYARDPA